MAYASSQQHQQQQQYTMEHHREPEKPLVYEPPDLQGRKHVEKVAGEYRVREDGCLADKLQSEEFEYHFGKNKSERFLGKIDIKTAKDIYLREVEQSGLLSKDELNKLNNRDAAIARDIDNQINENLDIESQRKQATEMQDEEFARYLEAKERQRHEEERKKRLERRIAQDRAEAERLQRSLEEEACREEQVARGMKDLKVKSSQKGGWAIDCEVGTTLGEEKTQKELQQLKDEEVARSLQLKDAELEKKRIREERDRRIALKLQKQEAEEYKRRQQEKQMRRAQSERRPTEEDIVTNDKRKRLQSVDARGRPIQDESDYREHPRAHTVSSQTASDKSSDRHSRENGRLEVSGRQGEESLYLQAVDSSRLRDDARMRTKQPINDAKVIQQQHQLHDDALRRTNSTQARISDVDRRSSHRSSRGSKHSGNDKSDQDRRLIDDQNVLRQQAKSIKQTSHSGSQQSCHRSSVRSRNSQEETTWDLQVAPVKDSQPLNGNPRQDIYDTPEENNRIEYNVARAIDPTYQTIGPTSKLNGQVGILETEQTVADVRPVPVIKNVKRPSKEEQKKKKKWFSKKDNSSS